MLDIVASALFLLAATYDLMSSKGPIKFTDHVYIFAGLCWFLASLGL